MLGSPENLFKIGGKVVQMTDIHQCSKYEAGIANLQNLIWLQITIVRVLDKL
jgi:hypothetical protein